MFKVNPYRPGAGLMPIYLAGREEEIENTSQMFEALGLNIPTQSVIFTGLRGVGKTVLMNRLQKIAEEKGIFCKHIEVETRNDFISQIAACAQMFLREISAKERAKHLIKKSLDAIKSLVVSFDPNDSTFSLSLQERELFHTVNLTQSLTDVFTTIGETAYETATPICFFVDEIQYMKKEELGSLIAALHRANQLGYPIMMIGAGLPKIYKMLSAEKTYSERLFVFHKIGALDEEQAKRAIVQPAKEFSVSYTDEAAEEIVAVTKGYPFFIQQFCQIVYQEAEGSEIGLQDVKQALADFYRTLDDGFFKVRYERCSDGDKKFIFAMVKCGELPCTVAEVSTILGKRGKSLSPIRAQLINKGLIYPVRYGELDFTVPEFDGFIRRREEYQRWNAQ